MAIQFTQAEPIVVNAVVKPLANALVNALPSPAPVADMRVALLPCAMVRDKGQAKPKRKRKTYADGHAIDTRQAYMREYMRKLRASGKPNAV